jgi:hypothetical protein
MPAVSTTMVMLTEMQTFTAICRRIFQPLSMVRNLSDKILMHTHNTSNAISDWNLFK